MSFHAGQTFTFGEQPSATKWQWVWDNDDALADGTGLEDDIIDSRHVVAGAIDPEHLASTVWGWEELGRTTLGSAGDSISITPITVKKYLLILYQVFDTGGAISPQLQFNGDTGANYAERFSANGAADTTQVSQNQISAGVGNVSAPAKGVFYVMNILAREKLVVGNSMHRGTAGAGNAPGRIEIDSKWANTAAAIARVDLINGGAGSFDIGSELVVLGHN
jgi:hypothetical protein